MTLDTFFKSINGKTIGFCGIARSNLPVMQLFAKYGAKIIARDKNTKLDEAMSILDEIGAVKILGEENYLENINEDILLRSPGVPFLLPQLQEAIARGVNVTSEMEIFFELCPCKIFAVTGSDGKTTTTSVISEMLKADDKRVHLGGNIGRPLLPIIEEISEFDYAVVELSSFQLISMKKSPNVAVITNLSPNHLDVHKDMQEYIDAKLNIFLHQNKKDRVILNMDNELTYSVRDQVVGDLWTFSRKNEVPRGAYAKDGKIFVDGIELMKTSDIKINGLHNVENYLAAISAVWGEVSEEAIVATAKTFGGVAHRAEFVREFDGVRYYNDSIASSPARAMNGTLSLYDKKIIMLAGGADKGVPFDELGEVICDKVKVLILIKPEEQLEGFKKSAVEQISEAVRKSKKYFDSNPLIIRVKDMQEAVNAAREIAEKGDIVSLCPACTSFDMYKNFEIRGNHFKELVMQMNEFED